MTPQQLSTHGYVIGATGAGKTCLLQSLVAGDIMRGHSIVALDARGDFASVIIELAARAGIDPCLIRFFDLREKVDPLGFNPLGGAGDPYFKALGFIQAIESESASWGVQIAEYLQNAALLLAETGKPITSLDGLFYDRAVRLSLISAVQTESLRQFWARYDALTPDRQSSIASSVLNKVSPLLCTEGLRRMYGHSNPVDLGAHLRTPGSITIISLAVDELHQVGWRSGSLFLSSICREIFSQVHVPERQRNPVRLYVDEFENFGWDNFESILAEGRRFRLSVLMAHQTIRQLDPKLLSIILGNVGLKVVMRTSHRDSETLNRDLTGMRGAFDIARLKVGEAVLWRSGEEPFIIELNAPLIPESGYLSPIGCAFLARVKAYAAEIGAVAASKVVEPTFPSNDGERIEPPSTRKSRRSKSTGLEDWLE